MAKTTHTLVHLGHHVRTFGPLWTASCFPFESFYHYTVKLVHGTRYVLHQVRKKKEKKRKKKKTELK